MSKDLFTPGPWTWLSVADDFFAVCTGLETIADTQTVGNARLIAAAPCLLAAAELALANLMRNLESEEATGQPFMGDDEHESISVLRTAIAKARGDA